MKNLICAIQFLTSLPVGKSNYFSAQGMIPFFPVVGILLGTIVSIFDQVAMHIFPVHVASLLDVVLLTILTGALHIDGLGDTADGLFSHRSKERMLEIMKDSRVGTMGLIAIVLVTAVKWAGISEMSDGRRLLLIIVPAISRSGMMIGIRFLPYGRPNGGTGHDFFKTAPGIAAFWAVSIPIVLSLFLGWRGLWLLLVFGTVTAVLLIYYRRRLGCITGDMLGAMNETLEAALFLAASM